MIYFKGDIIQKGEDLRGNKLEWCWGSELVGVNNEVTLPDAKLWHRPFKNKIKYLIWCMFNVRLSVTKTIKESK